jgi:hypothetical protein
MNTTTETTKQSAAINRLARLGYSVTCMDPDGEAQMSRSRRGQMLLATVGADGSVNGEPLAEFIAWHKSLARG